MLPRKRDKKRFKTFFIKRDLPGKKGKLHLPLPGVQTNIFFLLSAFTFSSSLYLSLFAWPVTKKRMTKRGGDTSALNGKRRGLRRKKGEGKDGGKGRGVKLVD